MSNLLLGWSPALEKYLIDIARTTLESHLQKDFYVYMPTDAYGNTATDYVCIWIGKLIEEAYLLSYRPNHVLGFEISVLYKLQEDLREHELDFLSFTKIIPVNFKNSAVHGFDVEMVGFGALNLKLV